MDRKVNMSLEISAREPDTRKNGKRRFVAIDSLTNRGGGGGVLLSSSAQVALPSHGCENGKCNKKMDLGRTGRSGGGEVVISAISKVTETGRILVKRKSVAQIQQYRVDIYSTM